MNKVKISVRNLVSFVERSGDIDTGFYSNVRAVEGTKIHQKIQSEYSGDFTKEYYLKFKTAVEDVEYTVEGRADGVSLSLQTVDEIKTTTRELDSLSYNSNKLHWSQAKCYAYFLAKEKDFEKVKVRLTYFQMEDEKIKEIEEEFTACELEEFFNELILKYHLFIKEIVKWKNIRNESVKEVKFPFENYRKGQRQIAVATYSAIRDEEVLYIEAPTGVGKSISTIFPAIKSIGEGIVEKVFYLVGRSTQKIAAENAVEILRDKDLELKTLTIQAKEKICINETFKCNPKDCKYAKGHFDRVNEAIIELFKRENFLNSETIQEFSKEKRVCPFELELDMSNFCDFIICDYNYAFDPTVQLKRYFESPEETFALLIDEAHTLEQRERDMYSAVLFKDDIKFLYENIPWKSIRKHAESLIHTWDGLKDLSVLKEYPFEIDEDLELMLLQLNKYLISKKDDENYDRIMEIYFALWNFLKIGTYYSDNFRTIVKDGEIKILCLDTGEIFENILKKSRGAVLFSATLTPMSYYMEVLSNKTGKYMRVESPFPWENLSVETVPLKCTYRYRDENAAKIAEEIKKFTDTPGNYLVFFPSYDFMEKVYGEFKECPEILIQERNMKESEREEFISNFKEDTFTTAFAVLGGPFSESIDLAGKRLTGVAVVTVGIPTVTFERNILKDFYENKNKRGFLYAYIIPGMCKVNQAGGRVIRTDTDKGRILLIDERFNTYPYRDLIPPHWNLKQ